MEDIMQFLVVAGIIAFGVYRQFSKEKEKNAENGIPIPTNTHAPETLAPLDVIKKQTKKHANKPLPLEGVRTTHTSVNSVISPPKEEKEPEMNDSGFAIHSTEEARRAIIWSEILQRKY